MRTSRAGSVPLHSVFSLSLEQLFIIPSEKKKKNPQLWTGSSYKTQTPVRHTDTASPLCAAAQAPPLHSSSLAPGEAGWKNTGPCEVCSVTEWPSSLVAHACLPPFETHTDHWGGAGDCSPCSQPEKVSDASPKQSMMRASWIIPVSVLHMGQAEGSCCSLLHWGW